MPSACPPSRARPPTPSPSPRAKPSPSPRAKASQDPRATSNHGGGESHGGVKAPTPPPVAGASSAQPPTRLPPLPSSSLRVNLSEDPTKHQDGDQVPSMEKRKSPSVQRPKAPDAKRFKSPMAMAPIPVKSPGIRFMLSPKLTPPSPIAMSPSQGFSHQNRRRKLKSDIWKQFEPIYDGKTLVKAKCIHCNKLFKASRDLGTSGCRRHLKACEGKSRLDQMVTQLKSASLSLLDDTLKTWKFDQEASELLANDSFLSSLQENLKSKCVLFHDGELLHYRCAAHVLNLIAQEGLKAMKGAVDNIRESVRYVRSSPSRKERFEKIVHRVGISYSQQPTLDVASRWNSTYEMLLSASNFKRAFEALATEDPQYLYQPSVEEWKMAKKLCSMLKIFSDATQVVSGSQYPTANLYFHQLWEVKKMLENEASSSEGIIVSMVQEMKKKLQKYWDLSFLKICIPVVLDPRFKLGFLNFRLKQGFGKMAMVYFSKIERTFRELFDEYSLQSEDQISSNAQPGNSGEPSVDENNPWADWGQYQNLMHKKKISELEEYLNEETVPIEGPFDILNHWKVYSKKYPILGRMARDILAIPASTVASESAFSTGERVISDYRSRLSSDTVEALICLQDWLRSKDNHSNCDNIAGNMVDEDDA